MVICVSSNCYLNCFWFVKGIGIMTYPESGKNSTSNNSEEICARDDNSAQLYVRFYCFYVAGRRTFNSQGVGDMGH